MTSVALLYPTTPANTNAGSVSNARPTVGDSVSPCADEVCETAPTLTDEEREAAIARAGKAVERHMAEWERSGCFAARGDASRALRAMEALIAGRSEAQVAKLEQERGLA